MYNQPNKNKSFKIVDFEHKASQTVCLLLAAFGKKSFLRISPKPSLCN